ncbi:FAD-binding protein [Providencia rettgeri]|nr:FAD-binding protein [Providencia rettgeri]
MACRCVIWNLFNITQLELPGSGILMTEGCRGEGGILVNKDGYRYLQDYGMGPETPLGKPENKYGTGST